MYTPTSVILDKSTEVEAIIYDSLDGGRSVINANFMTVQATVRPGLLEVMMKGGLHKKFVTLGGIIQKNTNNSVDCALFEAYNKADIDWEELKKSDAFASEPVGDTSSEAEYLRKVGQSLRDDIATASASL
jgi:F0F1-type ATP synthase epsilon subunit